MAKRMPKSLKIFTEPRDDASGTVSVHQGPAGSVLVRRTSQGWLAHNHEIEPFEDSFFVVLDSIRLKHAGPWRKWRTSIGDQEFAPEPFALVDRQEVSSGPDGEALRIMAGFGPFSIVAHGDRVLLFSEDEAIVGPLEEWRPKLAGIEVPESVLGALGLGPDEFEISEGRIFVRAAGALRISARVEPAACEYAETLISLATVEGPKIETVPDRLKPVKKLDIRVTDFGEGKKYSAAIAPGWTFASVIG